MISIIQWGGGVVAEIFRDLNQLFSGGGGEIFRDLSYRIGLSGGGY